MSYTHVKGFEALQKMLDTLPKKIEANIMRSALRAGAKVVLQAARSNAPVAPPSGVNAATYGGYAGALRDSLRVKASVRGGKVRASVVAGGNKNGADVYYAKWVEFGTAAHAIMPKNKQALTFGGKSVFSVDHPGAKPRPFLLPAFYSQRDTALRAVGEAIKKRLTKAGLDATDIEVDV